MTFWRFVEIAWHWLSTSRYTRKLEAEVCRLEGENRRLQADNDGLLRALYPALRAIRTEHEAESEVKKPVQSAPFHWGR